MKQGKRTCGEWLAKNQPRSTKPRSYEGRARFMNEVGRMLANDVQSHQHGTNLERRMVAPVEAITILA